MEYIDRMDNVFMIDTGMFGFKNYMSAYLVKGDKLALVDTGVPSSWDALCAGIKRHGFSLKDISYIFVGHEHPDHYGGVSKLLKESSDAAVYIHPVVDSALKVTEAEQEKSPFTRMAGTSKPVPDARICHLHDGEIFDLGGGEKLEIYFTPGHLPGAITIIEHKNNGLFINDLIGNYFPDADAHLILIPPGSDILQQIESMKKLMKLPVRNLYLGHFGIVNDNVMQLMSDTLEKMQQVLEIGQRRIEQGEPDKIVEDMYAYVKPYAENMRRARGEVVYEYMTQLHLPFLVNYFAEYCKQNLSA